MPLRRLPAPLLTAALLGLIATMVIFWGRSGGKPEPGSPVTSLRTARVANIRANLADAGCLFTADVELGSVWQQLVFARVRQDARKEFVTMMRYKRRYMVDNPVARQALAAEMAGKINSLARADIAKRVDIPKFEFF